MRQRHTIAVTVNGASYRREVEARLLLSDFLRHELGLTGTHVGCEHGVCGACTILFDGESARSCLMFAVQADGHQITTVEGLAGDKDHLHPLQQAFREAHGLQCGYCTPGMLVSARDLVLRMPQATEREIRIAMSGNLCRCTGYAGIVRAIQRVLAERQQKGIAAANPRSALGPAGAGHASASDGGQAVSTPRPTARAETTRTIAASAASEAMSTPQTTLHESFIVDHPLERVWSFFEKPAEVAQCLPGTSVIGTPSESHVDTRMRVRAGPIVAEFEGGADVTRDADNYSGVIRGHAQDARSRSATRGEIRYQLHEVESGTATRVDVEIRFTLTGPLAQFSRSSLVRDIARRMTEAFSRNLQARLGGNGGAAVTPSSELNAGSLFASALWQRVKAFLRRLAGN